MRGEREKVEMVRVKKYAYWWHGIRTARSKLRKNGNVLYDEVVPWYGARVY